MSGNGNVNKGLESAGLGEFWLPLVTLGNVLQHGSPHLGDGQNAGVLREHGEALLGPCGEGPLETVGCCGNGALLSLSGLH